MSEPKTRAGAVDAGVFVAAVVLMFVSGMKGWSVLMWLCVAVVIGVMVTTAARRQLREGEDRSRSERPWRRDR